MGANFPDTPASGDEFVTSNLKWTYDGVKWTASGGVAVFADAPEDGNLYGRVNAEWASGGLIGGDMTFRAGAYFAESAAFANGATFGAVTGADALDLSRHIDLYGGSYGLSITGGTLNLVAEGAAMMQVTGSGATVNGALTTTSNMHCEGGIVYSQAPAGANAHFWMLDSSGGDTAGILYWEHSAQSIILTNRTGGGNFTINNNGTMSCNGYFDIGTSARCRGSGFNYTGGYSSGNYFLFGWSTVVSGLATVVVDNGNVAYSIGNGSDRRLKHDIAPSTFDCLSTVMEIPLRQYRWKEVDDPGKLPEARDNPRSRLTRVGMVAQEILRILPEGVREGSDFADKIGVMWDLDRNVMVSLLVGAVQQLTARVAELEGAR
jgi:hypothetical protein